MDGQWLGEKHAIEEQGCIRHLYSPSQVFRAAACADEQQKRPGDDLQAGNDLTPHQCPTAGFRRPPGSWPHYQLTWREKCLIEV